MLGLVCLVQLSQNGEQQSIPNPCLKRLACGDVSMRVSASVAILVVISPEMEQSFLHVGHFPCFMF